MEFGVCLFCTDPPEDFVEKVRIAEGVGFNYLWLADTSPHAHEIFCYLTLAAINSSSIGLGPGVLHPYVRHLALSVAGIATIDHLSGGRARLGLGTGGSPTAPLGYKAARLAVMRAAIDLARRLMRGEAVDSEVAPVQMHGARLGFPPARPLPVYLAATGPKALALGGELADGVFVHAGLDPNVVRAALASCAEGGHARPADLGPLDVSPYLYTAVGSDRARAYAACRKGAALVVRRFPQYAALAGVPEEVAAATGRGEPLPDEYVDRFSLSGTVEDCIRKLEALAELGIRHVSLVPTGDDQIAMLRMIGERLVARHG